MDALLDDWLSLIRLAAPAAASDRAAEAGRDLLRRWSEPHRHYHTVDHLVAILSILDESGDAADDPAAVRLAAWFHDAVYDPRHGDNEEASAQLAERVLGALGAQADEVARLVRLTATHDPAPDDRNGALLCDADLAILAAAPDAYRRYAAAVRAEYTHVPDDLFRAGRAAVLRDLLGHATIFHCAAHRSTWEKSARNNMSSEVSALTASPVIREPLDP